MSQLSHRLKKIEKHIDAKVSATWTVICRGEVIEQFPIGNNDYAHKGSVEAILPDEFWKDYRADNKNAGIYNEQGHEITRSVGDDK